MQTCKECDFRKAVAKSFDMHIDWRDCWKEECKYRDKKEGVTMQNEIKPCPFCGNDIRIVVCDDEGNIHNEDYENVPWSGLGYMLYHDITDDPTEECPIAGHEGEGVMGIHIYDTREEAAEAWNRRVDNG